MADKVLLGDAEFEIEHVEKFTLDPPYVTFTEDTCAKSPVYVFESGVVEVLCSAYKCTEENPFVCPFFESDVQMWFGSVDVYESTEKGGHGHFCASDDVGDEGVERDGIL